jgi:AcrR family transcriptional regulator
MTRASDPAPARTRRIRRDPDTTRALILDAAERLMVEEGYASVSSRRVAHDIGLNAATVHYYYPATDDLFVALHRRMTDRQVAELEAVLAAEKPLEAFWALQSGEGQSALGVEFLALANHRKALARVFAQSTDAARRSFAARLATASGGALDADEALALVTALTAIGRLLANEARVGLGAGHAEVRRLVADLLHRAACAI